MSAVNNSQVAAIASSPPVQPPGLEVVLITTVNFFTSTFLANPSLLKIRYTTNCDTLLHRGKLVHMA